MVQLQSKKKEINKPKNQNRDSLPEGAQQEPLSRVI